MARHWRPYPPLMSDRVLEPLPCGCSLRADEGGLHYLQYHRGCQNKHEPLLALVAFWNEVKSRT